MVTNEQILETIEKKKIIVIVRRTYGEDLMNLTRALHDGGIRLMECTFDQSDPECLKKTGDSIRMLTEAFPDMYFGAGTVLNRDQVNAAAKAGGRFIISPNTNTDVIGYTKSLGLISIPGAMTPSEILAAHDAGADVVKLFPAIDLGLTYVKNIKGPISHVKLLATAGVNEENFADFLKVGYIGAGISGRLTDKKVIACGNFEEFTHRAEAFCKIAEEN